METPTHTAPPVALDRLVLGLCECGCGATVRTKGRRFAPGHHSRVAGPGRDAWLESVKASASSDETRKKVSEAQKRNWKSGRTGITAEGAKKISEKLREGFASGRIKHRGALPAETMARIAAENSARNKGRIMRKTEQQEWEKDKLRERIAADPRTAKGVENQMAKWWHLRSPNNRTFRFKNLLQFVRDNPALFDPEDVQWRPKGCHLVCKASNGLAILSPRQKNPKGTWKGWTWVSITEKITNDGEDLLGRISSENATVEARRQ